MTSSVNTFSGFWVIAIALLQRMVDLSKHYCIDKSLFLSLFIQALEVILIEVINVCYRF